MLFLVAWSVFLVGATALAALHLARRRVAYVEACWHKQHLGVVAGMNRYIYRTEHHLKALQTEVARLGGDPAEIEARSCAETLPTIRKMIREAIAAAIAPAREELDS